MTPKEAKELSLPSILHPITRHRQVAMHIQELGLPGAKVSVSRFGDSVRVGGEIVHVPATGPVLGRSALVHAAVSVNWLRQRGLLERVA